MTLDLVITGGTIATATDTFRADIGIRGGRIAAIGEGLSAPDTIDATGQLVLPGGIEAHCHIAQESASGLMTADDYETGSISAAFGGNSSFIPFAAQQRGQSVADTIALYDSRATGKSVIDYSYHLIITDPTEQAVTTDLPAAFTRGITSFKVFMTYPLLAVDDTQFLAVLACAAEHGALTMVHAENMGIIAKATADLLAAGKTAPKYHAPSHPPLAEIEAINRAICLARTADAPLLIVHVSTPEGAALVREARAAGQPIYGETCPQYLFLTADDIDRPGYEGAKYVCSPPLRDEATQQALWRAIETESLSLVSSDHAPYRYDDTGKFAASPAPTFAQIANGMPGIELRLPMLFSAGVRTGRITLNQFVAYAATNAARLYGMPRKGTIAIGADADIAIWNPDETRVVRHADLHDAMDYTPYEGMGVTGWPVTVLNRGRRIVENGALLAKPGDGAFVVREPHRKTAHA